MHRVVNKLGRERYSIAVIASPDFDTEVRFHSDNTRIIHYLSLTR